MDPNFIKLFKLAQLTIEYLLVCLLICLIQLEEFIFL